MEVGQKVILRIQTPGWHIPSKKNKLRSKNGGVYLRKDTKEALEWITRSIGSSIVSAFRITEDEMATGCKLPSKIASSVPLDDSRAWIESWDGQFKVVPPGQEGVDIMLIRIR